MTNRPTEPNQPAVGAAAARWFRRAVLVVSLAILLGCTHQPGPPDDASPTVEAERPVPTETVAFNPADLEPMPGSGPTTSFVGADAQRSDSTDVGATDVPRDTAATSLPTPGTSGGATDAGYTDESGSRSWFVTLASVLGVSALVLAAVLWMIRINRLKPDRDDADNTDSATA